MPDLAIAIFSSAVPARLMVYKKKKTLKEKEHISTDNSLWQRQKHIGTVKTSHKHRHKHISIGKSTYAQIKHEHKHERCDIPYFCRYSVPGVCSSIRNG